MVSFLRKVLVNNGDYKIYRLSSGKNCVGGEGLTTVASRIIKGSCVVAPWYYTQSLPAPKHHHHFRHDYHDEQLQLQHPNNHYNHSKVGPFSQKSYGHEKKSMKTKG